MTEKKRKLCEDNGIRLIEWPYKELITEENLKEFSNVKYVHGNHDDIKQILEELGEITGETVTEDIIKEII